MNFQVYSLETQRNEQKILRKTQTHIKLIIFEDFACFLLTPAAVQMLENSVGMMRAFRYFDVNCCDKFIAKFLSSWSIRQIEISQWFHKLSCGTRGGKCGDGMNKGWENRFGNKFCHRNLARDNGRIFSIKCFRSDVAAAFSRHSRTS